MKQRILLVFLISLSSFTARGAEDPEAEGALTGGGAVGEIVRFREENGQVTRVYVGESYSERVR